MKSNAACWSFVLEPTESSQPPDMLFAPGACPFWVGIAASPMTVFHCGPRLGDPGTGLPVAGQP